MKQKREEEPHPQSYAEMRRNAKNNEGIETPRSRNAKNSEEDGIAATHKKKQMNEED